MEEGRNSFVFYRSFYEAIRLQPKEMWADLYDAVADYALNGVLPDEENHTLYGLFVLMKAQLDANNNRYENGKKGGRPKREKPTVSEKAETEKPKVSEKAETEKPTVSEKAEIKKPNVNENENENVNVKKHIPAKIAGDVYSPEFQQFWNAYPNKKNKGTAVSAWNKLKVTQELFQKIMEGLDKAKNSQEWARDDSGWIPHPATWLNALGWENEYKPLEGRGGKAPERVNVPQIDPVLAMRRALAGGD